MQQRSGGTGPLRPNHPNPQNTRRQGARDDRSGPPHGGEHAASAQGRPGDGAARAGQVRERPGECHRSRRSAAAACAGRGGRRGGAARRLARPVDRGPGAGRSHTFSGASGEDADQGEIVNMWIINTALIRPFTILVAVIAIALCSVLALTRMPVDIFPNLNLPVIYVAQPYGGMDPAQMESYLVSYYEYHFLYVAGIEHVESKSIQNVGLIKLFFHPGTDMSQALAQTIAYVERSRAFMPPGTVSPFVVRFDAGSVPVGQLVFSSETRSVGEIQDLALFRVRPTFATLPGVSAPPPFGGNQRTVVIRVDPDRLREIRMSPDEVARAVSAGNAILPGANLRTGDITRIAQVNSPVPGIKDLEMLPIRAGSGATVYLRDIATVNDSSDVATGYALVNGRRTVYIPVTKRSDASTLDVVQRV